MSFLPYIKMEIYTYVSASGLFPKLYTRLLTNLARLTNVPMGNFRGGLEAMMVLRRRICRNYTPPVALHYERISRFYI